MAENLVLDEEDMIAIQKEQREQEMEREKIAKLQQTKASEQLHDIYSSMSDTFTNQGCEVPSWLKREMNKSEKILSVKERTAPLSDYMDELLNLRDTKKEIKQLNSDIRKELLVAKKNGFEQKNIDAINKLVESVQKKSEDAILLQEKMDATKSDIVNMIKTPVVTAGKTLASVGASAKDKAFDGVKFVGDSFNNLRLGIKAKIMNGIDALKGIKDCIVDANKKFAKGAKNAYDVASNTVKDKASDVSKTVVTSGKSLYDGAKTGAKTAYDATTNTVTTAGKKLSNNIKTTAKNIADKAYSGVMAGIDKIHTKYLEANYVIDSYQSDRLKNMQEKLENKYSKRAEIRGALKNLGRAIIGKEQDNNVTYTAREQAKMDKVDNKLSKVEGRMSKTAEQLNLNNNDNLAAFICERNSKQSNQQSASNSFLNARLNNFVKTLQFDDASAPLKGAGVISIETDKIGSDNLLKSDLSGEMFENLDVESMSGKTVFASKVSDKKVNIIYTGFDDVPNSDIKTAIEESVNNVLDGKSQFNLSDVKDISAVKAADMYYNNDLSKVNNFDTNVASNDVELHDNLCVETELENDGKEDFCSL